MIFKFLINIILVSNYNIGIYGAAIGNIVCNLIVCSISFFSLIKNIKLNISIKDFIIEPILTTVIMSIVAIIIKFFLASIIAKKMVTILSIAVTAMIYTIVTLALALTKKHKKEKNK